MKMLLCQQPLLKVLSMLFLYTTLLFSTVFAASLKGQLATNVVMQDLDDLPAGTKVVINHGEYVSYLTEGGEFYFPNIRDGSHLLQVLCRQYDFNKIRLDVTGKTVRASITETGKGWAVHGKFVDTPLFLEPLGSFNFFKARESFNIMSLFANPMLLMSGGTMLLFFLLPKLQAGIDRDAVEEYKNDKDAPKLPSLEMPDISKNLADFFVPNDRKVSNVPAQAETEPITALPTPARATPNKSGKKKKEK
ncbi:hypothetical protein BSLG_004755 [Batrachochytrium salamandrivorans]|nr:hypothetical protein BSLG_004755 [Batrachochytrium salamandrivorans]